MFALLVIYGFPLTSKMDKLKQAIPTFNNDSQSPERREFARLHRLCVRLMGANLFLGGAAWLLILFQAIAWFAWPLFPICNGP